MIKHMQNIFDNAIRDKVTPGIAASILLFEDHQANSIDFFAGKLEPGSPIEVNRKTIYDLASLTKLISTTLLSAIAIDLGKLGIDEKPWPLWPEVSVAHVLSHTAGLVAWLPLYKEARAQNVQCTARGEEVVVRGALASKPIAPAGVEFLYSDIGYIALGALLQQRLGDQLDVLFADASWRFWKNKNSQYRCLYKNPKEILRDPVAPTGENPWFKKNFCGQVHDPNCYAMGGISGHAGLFGNLEDVKEAAAFFITALKGDALGVYAVLRDFSDYLGPHPLGFDKPTPGGSTDNCFSEKSVGHLGFTGTSLWLDPLAMEKSGAGYILLSNRVYFGIDSNEAITELRRSFHRSASLIT
jgi:serine-type D-Ala-D-Ala carboxypeptidase